MQRREVEYPIKTPEQIELAVAWVKRMVMMRLNAGKSTAIRVGAERRNLEQSAKFHAMCGDAAKQATYMGRKLSSDQWKVIFISGHAIATGLGADMVPGLEGEFVNIRESSALMSKKRIASLIEYVYAWGAGENIKWSDPTMSEMYPEYAQ